jgi:hypothetical protein
MKVLLFLLLVLPLPLASNRQRETENSVTNEEYAVYSAILNKIEQSPNDGKEVKLVVINDQTNGPDNSCFPEKIAKWNERISANELKPIFDDLIAKNKESKTLVGKQFQVKHKSVLLNVRDFSLIFKKKDLEGWTDFYRTYPNSSGFITFSRVGFSSDATRAIVYEQNNCDSLCGYGGYILLSKEKGEWKVVTGFGCWQS